MSTFWEKLTLELSEEKQRQEFMKKYSGCYLFLKKTPKDAEILVTLHDYDKENKVYLFQRDSLTLSIKHKTDVEIIAKFPTNKFINIDNTFLYFYRIPARQYRKAPCADNCAFINPFGAYNLGIYHNSPAQRTIEEAFEPQYLKMNEAIALLEDGKTIGKAITEQFAISLHPNDEKKYLLWLRTFPVAVVSGSTISVVVPQLKQELIDLVNRNRLEFIVK